MEKTSQKLIAYARVSTHKQGESGLGLDAQRTAVENYAKDAGGVILTWYVEVESGKLADRPELAKALAHAKHAQAKLVIAKLDRLARNMAFTSAVMDSGVEFVCCDNPHANRLTLHILAAVAEDEARRISDRTKAALAAAKKRGVKLGSARPGHWADPKRRERRMAGLLKGTKAAAVLRLQAAAKAYAHVEPLIREGQAQGMSLRQIATTLNAHGHLTAHRKSWGPMQVARVIGRLPAT